MTSNDRARRYLDRARRTGVYLALLVGVGLIFYVVPGQALTIGAALASAAIGIVLICMMQSRMTDSSLGFRLAMAGLTAGSLADVFAPFVHGYHIGPWGFLKTIALLALVSMMRRRQIKAADRTECNGAGLQS